MLDVILIVKFKISKKNGLSILHIIQAMSKRSNASQKL